MHTCPAHVGGPTSSGEETVIIGYECAARVGDSLVCQGPDDAIAKGEPTVIIGFREAARRGDPTGHGGRIKEGCPTVRIGSSAQADALRTDKPFCEECERKRREQEAQQERSGGG
jgi:uncharacterized Zn-binding protein involved in type VI secretion